VTIAGAESVELRTICGGSVLDGFYFACELSGTGFKTSPAAGASMMELMLDGGPTTVDITPFRFERFAEGQLFEGEYGYGHIWK
jgi:glycine/D-amino acid oxidase-like deaminating enzyme